MVLKRNTIQRQLILDSVRELNIHASAEEVYEHLSQKYQHIGKATVYRNLNLMAESGELLNIGDFDGAAHYDHNCHKHYHCMCRNCKKIFDVEGDFDEIVGKIGKTEGFDITDCSITFSGLCWECKPKNKKKE